MMFKWMCVVSPGEAELQSFLQVLPQTVLRILLLGIASCWHARNNQVSETTKAEWNQDACLGSGGVKNLSVSVGQALCILCRPFWSSPGWREQRGLLGPRGPDQPASLELVEAHLGLLEEAPCELCLHWLHSLKQRDVRSRFQEAGMTKTTGRVSGYSPWKRKLTASGAHCAAASTLISSP